RQQSCHVPLHFDGDRKCFLAARSRRGHATGLMDHLADVEVAIWAVRNHRLARLEEQEDILAIGDPIPPKRTRMRRRNRSTYNSLLGSGTGTRNRPIAPVESGPCCQDSPMLSTIGFDDRACQTSTSIANADPAARFRDKMVTLGPVLTLPCAGRR